MLETEAPLREAGEFCLEEGRGAAVKEAVLGVRVQCMGYGLKGEQADRAAAGVAVPGEMMECGNRYYVNGLHVNKIVIICTLVFVQITTLSVYFGVWAHDSPVPILLVHGFQIGAIHPGALRPGSFDLREVW